MDVRFFPCIHAVEHDVGSRTAVAACFAGGDDDGSNSAVGGVRAGGDAAIGAGRRVVAARSAVFFRRWIACGSPTGSSLFLRGADAVDVDAVARARGSCGYSKREIIINSG